jgi:uncharacterized hydrophobic protein (TIGR00271 family)
MNQDREHENLNLQKEGLKKDFLIFIKSIKTFLGELLDIREGTDRKESIQKIKDGIPVKSHTAWILIFSIVIASIGLNTSSSAVVIGAMLISPLMGPILGVGLSIGTNDIDTLRRSMVNLGVMVGLSLLSSFLFFSIPIFQEATPEILARTQPDVRDVLIAIAGGLALIIALSRHREMTNTIAGIAIATALMPPLCTAGYGLATWNWKFFAGAMFLFTINTIFIALATFVIVKFLKFPVVRYIDSVKRKRIAQLASLLALVIFSFSIYLFYGLFQKNQFYQKSREFTSLVKEKTGAGVISSAYDFEKRKITLVVLGKKIKNNELVVWTEKLPLFGLENTVLEIQQDDETSKLMDEINTLKSSYVKNQELMASKEERLQEKETTIRGLEAALKKLQNQQVPFVKVSQEAKINYEELKEIRFSQVIKTNFDRIDTIPVFEFRWHDNTAELEEKEEQLQKWLKVRLELDTLQIRRSKMPENS